MAKVWTITKRDVFGYTVYNTKHDIRLFDFEPWLKLDR